MPEPHPRDAVPVDTRQTLPPSARSTASLFPNAEAPVRSFDEDGYCVLPAFISPSDLVPITDAVRKIVSRAPMEGMSRSGTNLYPLRWDSAAVSAVLGSTESVSTLAAAADARCLRWISGYVASKPPRSPALEWHQDWWCWDHPVSHHRKASQIALLCYLTPATSASGALRVLPGSHRDATDLHALLAASAQLRDSAAQAASILQDHPGQVTINAEPGDAVLIDYRLLHSTHQNRASRRRDCLLLSFAPHYSELPDDLKAHLALHPALPLPAEEAEAASSGYTQLLPEFSGTPASLPLNRVAPPDFRIG